MPIYKSDLRFQLWDYTVSHKQLLFRSVASNSVPVNTDIAFGAVDVLNIGTDFYGIELDIKEPARERNALTVFSLKCMKTGNTSTILAGVVNVFENDLGFKESSLGFSSGSSHDDYWVESKKYKLLYPNVVEPAERSYHASEAREAVSKLFPQKEIHDYKGTWELEKRKIDEAIQNKDWQAIRVMVSSNPLLVHRGFFVEWKNLLNEAVINAADHDTLRFLIESGADINRRGYFGETAIFDAVRSNAGLDMIRFLVDNGATLHPTALLTNGLLHLAAQYSDESVLEYLLSCGADPISENYYHERPIDLANTEAKKEILRKEMIVRGVDPEQKKPYG